MNRCEPVIAIRRRRLTGARIAAASAIVVLPEKPRNPIRRGSGRSTRRSLSMGVHPSKHPK